MMDLNDTAAKIASMEIRGAGLIARAAAEALRDYAQKIEASNIEQFDSILGDAADILLKTRPTAVSLSNAVRMVVRHSGRDVESARSAVVQNAERFISSSLQAVERIGEIGCRMIRDGDTIMTHCNSSAALAIIARAHAEGKRISAIATESRPRYQGHLTIQRLEELGVPTQLIVDSAVHSVINEADRVIVGADVVTASGTLVNKIGTSQIALCAHEARTPFIVAAETYKFSPATLMGKLVPIEERDPHEVLPEIESFRNVRVRNPAFDVTHHRYIDVICTEVGAIPPEMSYLIIKDYLGWDLPSGL